MTILSRSIESVVRITGITAYMLVRSPALGACALSIIPVIAVVNKFYGNWLSKNASQVQDALAEANSVAQETLSCIRTVVAFASEDLEYKKYVGKVDHQYRLDIRQVRNSKEFLCLLYRMDQELTHEFHSFAPQLFLTAIYYMCVSTFLVNTLVKSILLFVGSHLIETGRLTPEVLLAFMLYSGQLQVS
jgi:ABC-type multidrug transport system fused ATPase/permease subunit